MKKISIVINADDRLGHISPEIYGHFSQSDAGIYTRQMTGRYVNALASLIKRLITNKKERIDDYALFLYYKRNLFQ